MGLLDILRGVADQADFIPGFDPVKDKQGLLSQILRGRDQYGQTPPIAQPGTMQPANAVQKKPPMMSAPGGTRAALPMARPVPGDFKTKTNFIDFLNPFKDTGQILQDDTARYLNAHNRYTAQQAAAAAQKDYELNFERLYNQAAQMGLKPGAETTSYIQAGLTNPEKLGENLAQQFKPRSIGEGVTERIAGQSDFYQPKTAPPIDPVDARLRQQNADAATLRAQAAMHGAQNPSAGVSITNNLPNSVTENAFQKKVGEQAGDARKAINVAGDAAAHRLAQAGMMNALIDEIDYLGTGAETLLQAQKLGRMFGLNIGNDVAAKEAMKVLTNQMALALKQELPGPMSDGDRQFLQSIPANLGVTRSGNKALVFMTNKKAQFERDIQLSLLENNPQTAQEFDAWLQQFRSNYPPLFDEATQRDLLAALNGGQ